MTLPAARADDGLLRAWVIGVGMAWSVAFVAIALTFELQLYADGAMFSYAVAVEDVWAFHWHNISGRLSVYLLTLLPAELVVRLSGNPGAGIIVYGLLFYAAPLAGLIATFVADRSRNRILFVYACLSTAVLCPLVFGFPTEMWLAHALFWPALAVCHSARQTAAGTTIVFLLLLALAFTHEGALVLTAAIAMTLLPRGWRDAGFRRAMAISIVILLLAVVSKFLLPPDSYFAEALVRAALHFFDPDIFSVDMVLLLLATMAGYGAICLVLSRLGTGRAPLYAAGIVAEALAVYWLHFDQAIHASSRYYLRTALVILTPALAALAVIRMLQDDGRLIGPLSRFEPVMAAARGASRPLAAALCLVTLVHVVETAKFVVAWQRYRAAVDALATGHDSDPVLGDPRFVSSDRIAGDLNRLSWFSTTPYLSAIVAGFAPNRLVIDPKGNYFWLSCATATANAEARRAVPAETRDLVRTYSCLHR